MLYKLESLRGIAACLVVLLHSPFHFGSETIAFVHNSYLFVDFFFVLSGFVMTLAYSSRIRSGLNFQSYLILRLGRVYPLHIFMLFAWVPYILIMQYMFESGFGGSNQFDRNSLNSFVSNIFLIQSMGIHDYLGWNYPAWSISTEFFAYLFFYFLTVTIDKKDSVILPLFIAFVCYGIIISLGRNTLDITYNYGFFRCLGAFYLGVFIFRLNKNLKAPQGLAKSIPVAELLSVIFVTLSVTYVHLHSLLFIVAIMSFTFSIYVFSMKESGYIGKILLTKPFRKIGLWSYSIYMLHALILTGVSRIFEFILEWDIDSSLGYKSLLVNTALILVIVFLSKFSFNYIEVVFRNKSRQISKKYDKSMQPNKPLASQDSTIINRNS